jgi:nitrate reductase delta subunit
MQAAVFDAFAALVAYPDADFPNRLAEARRETSALNPAWGEALRPLEALLEASGPWALEELYTRTFDMNPACALETGWHLYGEDYDRGAFLVHLRSLLRESGIEETHELPDHLSHVLRLLGRLDADAAGALSRRQVLPALKKVLAALGDAANPYRAVVEGAADLLESSFGPADPVPASAFSCPSPYEGGGCCPSLAERDV